MDVILKYDAASPEPYDARLYDRVSWAGGDEIQLADFGDQLLGCAETSQQRVHSYGGQTYGRGGYGGRYRDRHHDRDRDRHGDRDRDRGGHGEHGDDGGVHPDPDPNPVGNDDRGRDAGDDRYNDEVTRLRERKRRVNPDTPPPPTRPRPRPRPTAEPAQPSQPVQPSSEPSTRPTAPPPPRPRPATPTPRAETPQPTPRATPAPARPRPARPASARPRNDSGNENRPQRREAFFQSGADGGIIKARYTPVNHPRSSGYQTYDYSTTTRLKCQRQEYVSIYISEDRLAHARSYGLNVTLRSRSGHRADIGLPANYVQGFSIALDRSAI